MSDNRPIVRLVDDDADLLAAQEQALRIAGFTPEPFSRAQDALAGLTADFPGVILSDVRMPGMDGLELFRRIHDMDEDLPVILLTGHGDVDMAVAALKAGAYDFLTKPVGLDALTAALRRASATRALVMENRKLRQGIAAGAPVSPLIGDSPVMSHLRDAVDRLAESAVDALILGPGGSGKETVARAIHQQSRRRARSFVQIACGTLDPDRFELDLLGAEAGQPGAPRHGRLIGQIEKSHRGTLFLDEIDALPPPLQARLLSIIESGQVLSQGAAAPRAVDLRILAASRSDLSRLVAQGDFRADLFYRLSGVTLHVPALAARRGDIPRLFRHFLIEASRRHDLPVPALTALTLARLQSHDWPGNLRELRQFAEGIASGVSAFAMANQTGDPGFTEMVASYEAEILRESLRLTGGNASRAMAGLRLPRKTFYDKLARHGIRPRDFRPD